MAFPDPLPSGYWPLNLSECSGLEFDWFCIDRHGFIALLSSAGQGFIPNSFFQISAGQYNTVIATLAGREKGAAIRVTNESGNFSDWKLYAEHGLFAFDFWDVHRTSAKARNGYDLIYKPDRPAHLDELPEPAKHCLPVIDADFASIDFLPIARLSDTQAQRSA